MKKPLLNWLGLTGIAALISYAAAVFLSPLAYPGYNALAQAVSDLSAQNAPSRMLWNTLAAPYNICSVVCSTCAAIYVSQNKTNTRLLRAGIYVFCIMNWVSDIGYAMFPLANSGKEITSFGEVGHIVVTALVVILSIASLLLLIIAGFRKPGKKSIGIWAIIALVMMLVGALGQQAVPPAYFGIVERFSVFSAVGFNAVLGFYLFSGTLETKIKTEKTT